MRKLLALVALGFFVSASAMASAAVKQNLECVALIEGETFPIPELLEQSSGELGGHSDGGAVSVKDLDVKNTNFSVLQVVSYGGSQFFLTITDKESAQTLAIMSLTDPNLTPGQEVVLSAPVFKKMIKCRVK